MKYRLAIFDIDGTLIDSEATGVLSLIETVKELVGRDMTYEEAYGFFGISSADVSAKLGYADGKRFGERWEDHFVEMSHMIKPYPGAAEIVSAVRGAGLMTAIVTARNHYELDKDVILAKMLEHFDFVVCADDTVRHKPDPEPMSFCVSKASALLGVGLQPEECVYLGDTVYDCNCAHGAGVRFALADWGKRGMQGIPAEHHFSSVSECLEIFGL